MRRLPLQEAALGRRAGPGILADFPHWLADPSDNTLGLNAAVGLGGPEAGGRQLTALLTRLLSSGEQNTPRGRPSSPLSPHRSISPHTWGSSSSVVPTGSLFPEGRIERTKLVKQTAPDTADSLRATAGIHHLPAPRLKLYSPSAIIYGCPNDSRHYDFSHYSFLLGV